MLAEDAVGLAQSLLAQHGLSRWTFRLDNARQRCGSCHFGRREITLSRHMVALNDHEEVRLTLLHEIAHALTGPGHGHNRYWRETVRKIGGSARVTNVSASMPDARWQLQCRQCERVVATRHRRVLHLARVRCGFCGVRDGELSWRDTHQETTSPST